uniref:Glycosyl transferase, family 2 n=1 Tax=Solibacter usitatus (strain Ellin6076) TaxID=234267 RepID=Q01V98_SOLUE
MKLSVVIISRNEGAELRRTVESFRATLPQRAEIVIVDDRSTDGSTRGLRRVIKTNGIGVACARNLGVSKTTGDMLFFADAHIRLEKNWWQPLAEVLEDRKVAAVAPAVTHLPATRRRGFGLTFTGPDLDARWLPRQGVTPFSAPILPGCSLMMRRATFDAVGGWDGGLLHRGGVDNEMSVRLWLLGYELMVAPQVVVPHLFRSASPYPVGWPQYLHNRLRLAFVHLNAARLARVVKALHKEPAFGEAMELLVSSDISARRRELLARRAHTDDWFFERFGLKW